MAARLLIAYASKYGSTRGIAEVMGQTLREAGARVDVRGARWISSIEGYDAVIVGAPIYFNRWLPEATDFVRRHWSALCRMPVAYFAVGLSMKDGSARSREEAMRAVAGIRSEVPEVVPTAIGLFTGALERREHPWFTRWLLRRVPEGDFRDWPTITAWTLALGFHHLQPRRPVFAVAGAEEGAPASS